MVTAKPTDTVAKVFLVDTLIDLKRIKEADNLNEELLKSSPGDAHALLSKGRILLAQARYQEAAEQLQNAMKAAPESGSNHYFLGVAQQFLGLQDLAKSSFANALKFSPQMTEAAVALAGIENKRGDFDEALRLAGKALQTNPNLALAYAASAQAQLAKGDLAQGEALLQEALKRDPTAIPALALMLALRVKQGRTKEAVEDLRTLTARNPREAGLHFLLAVGYFNLKDLDNSEASARRALELDSKTPDAYSLLGNIDLARGSVEKAKTDLEKAIALNPHNLSNYAALGSQFEKEKNWEEAKRLFEKAHGAEPDSAFVADELAYLYLEHGGDVNIALNLAQTAKQRQPNSPIAADALGWAYYKLGSTESAVDQLKECVRMVPKNPVFQYHLGMAYVAAGHVEAAKGSLRKAIETDPNFAFAASAKDTLAKISK